MTKHIAKLVLIAVVPVELGIECTIYMGVCMLSLVLQMYDDSIYLKVSHIIPPISHKSTLRAPVNGISASL